MGGIRLDVSIEVDEIVDGADHWQRHDDDPHDVDDVALDRAVDEDAVADHVVVVEVASDDRRTEVDNDAADVHHDDAKHGATEAAPSVGADVILAERVRLAADHRDDVETGSCHDDHVRSAQSCAESGRDVEQEAGRERDAVETFDHVQDAAVHDEGAGHSPQRLAGQDADDDQHVEDETQRGDGEEEQRFVDVLGSGHLEASSGGKLHVVLVHVLHGMIIGRFPDRVTGIDGHHLKGWSGRGVYITFNWNAA